MRPAKLRDLQPADEAILREWRNRPEISKYMYSDHAITRDEHRAWWRNANKLADRKYWMICLDDKPVGLANVVGIDEAHSRATWAFYLADSATRGRGVGAFVEYAVLRYVFDDLGLNRLGCEVLASNASVVDMHRGFGFTIEGTLRQFVHKGDAFVDVVQLSMLRSEFAAVRGDIEVRLRDKGLLE